MILKLVARKVYKTRISVDPYPVGGASQAETNYEDDEEDELKLSPRKE